MRPKPCLTACLMIVSASVAVASCATRGATFPPAADLVVVAKPVPPDDVLTSRIAGERHDNAVEAWGEAGWAAVARLCGFFDGMGMRGLDCRPRSPPQSDP